jgi:hypothetical protein
VHLVGNIIYLYFGQNILDKYDLLIALNGNGDDPFPPWYGFCSFIYSVLLCLQQFIYLFIFYFFIFFFLIL